MWDKDNPIEQLCQLLERIAKPVNVYWYWLGAMVLSVLFTGFLNQMETLGWLEARKTLAIIGFLYFVWMSLGRLHFSGKRAQKTPDDKNPPE